MIHFQLSKEQQKIIDCTATKIVVKACPGSGKTFTVSARMAKIFQEGLLSRHQGIASISFTNTACDVIKKQLNEYHGIKTIPYPSFVGTIDSFINTYILLPYGHLVLDCKERPEIVGTAYNIWYNFDQTKRGYNQRIIDPDYFMDKVSFNINNEPIRLTKAEDFTFSWDKIKKTNGDYIKQIANIIESKKKWFKEGKVNQADANYFAYKILHKYPLILKNIAARFPYFIIDEAQDTTDVQMKIIELLSTKVKSIMIIGDPDQAIFEWNSACPELFLDKYTDPLWTPLILNENRRSSSNICAVNNNLSKNDMVSISQYKNESDSVTLKSYGRHSAQQIVEEFKIKCKELSINAGEYSIVYRGKAFGQEYFNITDRNNLTDKNPWEKSARYVKDILYGKFLIDNNFKQKGLESICKGLLKLELKTDYISNLELQANLETVKFRERRKKLIHYINKLPKTDMTLLEWIKQAKDSGMKFSINRKQANIEIKDLFSLDNNDSDLELEYRTIHSVKGMTYKGVLVFITEKCGNKNYSTVLNSIDNQQYLRAEELRILYVAFTRPQRLLWIAVPDKDLDMWNNVLFDKRPIQGTLF